MPSLSRRTRHLRNFLAGRLSRGSIDVSTLLILIFRRIPTPQRSHRGGSPFRRGVFARPTLISRGTESFARCAIPALEHDDFKYLPRYRRVCVAAHSRAHACTHTRVSFARTGESSSLRGKPDKSFTTCRSRKSRDPIVRIETRGVV